MINNSLSGFLRSVIEEDYSTAARIAEQGIVDGDAPVSELNNRLFWQARRVIARDFEGERVAVLSLCARLAHANTTSTEAILDLLADRKKGVTLKIPESVLRLFNRIENLVNERLVAPWVVRTHWSQLFGAGGRSKTLFDVWSNRLSTLYHPLSLQMVLNALGGDWVGHRKTLDNQFLAAAGLFGIPRYVALVAEQVAEPNSPLSKLIAPLKQFYSLCEVFHVAEEPTYATVKSAARLVLKQLADLPQNDSLFIPVGWASSIGRREEELVPAEIHVLQVICREKSNKYQLRLFNVSHTDLQSKQDHAQRGDPAIDFEPVDLKRLSRLGTWSTLFEPFVAPRVFPDKSVVYHHEWLLAILQRLVGPIKSVHIAEMQTFLKTTDLYTASRSKPLSTKVSQALAQTRSDIDLDPKRPLSHQLLYPTRTELPNVQFWRGGSLEQKAVDLIALAKMHTSRWTCGLDYKLYRIQVRLLLLVHVHDALRQQEVAAHERRDMIEAAVKAGRKLFYSFHSLLSIESIDQMSREHRELFECYLATLLDWQSRFDNLLRSHESLNLSPPTYSLYPRKLMPCEAVSPLALPALLRNQESRSACPLNFSTSTQPIQIPSRALSNAEVESLTADLAARLDLLGAELKGLRHEEWLAQCYLQVILPLPIPSSSNTYWRLNEDVTERSAQQLTERLKQLSSLLLAHAQLMGEMLPWHVLGATKVFRIQLEIGAHFMPLLKQLPVCWAHLPRLLSTKGFDRFSPEIDEQLSDLHRSLESFCPIGKDLGPYPKGTLGEQTREVYGLFDWSWAWTADLQEQQPLRYRICEIDMLEDLDIKWYYNESASHVHAMADVAGRVGVSLRDAGSEIANWNQPRVFIYRALQNSAEMFQLSCCNRPKRGKGGEDSVYNSGPLDFTSIDHTRASNGTWADVYPHYRGASYGNKHIRVAKVANHHKLHPAIAEPALAKVFKEMVEQSVDQRVAASDIVKRISLSRHRQHAYVLAHIALGSATLALDSLLSHYEVRSSELMRPEVRAFFLSCLQIQSVARLSMQHEPLVVERIQAFVSQLMEIDAEFLHDQAHQARLVWLAELVSYLHPMQPEALSATRAALAKVTLAGMRLATGPSRGSLAMSYLALTDGTCDLETLTEALVAHGSLQGQDRSQMIQRVAVACTLARSAPAQLANIRTKQELAAAVRQVLTEPEASLLEDSEIVAAPADTLEELTTIARQLAAKQRLHDWYAEYKATIYDGRKWLDRETHWQYKGFSQHQAELVSEIQRLRDRQQELLIGLRTRQAQPNVWTVWHSSLIWITEQQITQIDFSRGTVARNGQYAISGHLPPDAQNAPQFSKLKQLPKLRMEFDVQSKHYKPEQPSAVSFTLYPHHAYLLYEGEHYRLIEPQQVAQFKLPCQIDAGFSLWGSSADSVTHPVIIAAHIANGEPVPAFLLNRIGQLVPLDALDLRLADPEPVYREAAPYERLGFSQREMMIWLNRAGQVERIDVPLWVGESRFLMVLTAQPKVLKGSVPGLVQFGDLLCLIEEGPDGRHSLMVNRRSTEELRARLFSNERNSAVWSRVITGTHEDRMGCYDLAPDGSLGARTSAEGLYLAYLKYAQVDYLGSITLLRHYLRPVGRCYTPEELEPITWILKAEITKDDEHYEACALRLFVRYHFKKHCIEFPVDKAALSHRSTLKQAVAYIQGAHSPGKLHNDVVSDMNHVLHGTKPRDALQLTHLFKPYEMEELILFYDVARGSAANLTIASRLMERVSNPEYTFSTNITRGTLVRRSDFTHGAYTDAHDYEKKESSFVFLNFLDSYVRPLFQEPGLPAIPFELFIFRSVPLSPSSFFRVAYELLTADEAKLTEPQRAERQRFEAYLDNWFENRARYISEYSAFLSYVHSRFCEEDIVMWMILLEIHQANHNGKRGVFESRNTALDLHGLPAARESRHSLVSPELDVEVRRIPQHWPVIPAFAVPKYSGEAGRGPKRHEACQFFSELEVRMGCSLHDLKMKYARRMARARTQIAVNLSINVDSRNEWSDRLELGKVTLLNDTIRQWSTLGAADRSRCTPCRIDNAQVVLPDTAALKSLPLLVGGEAEATAAQISIREAWIRDKLPEVQKLEQQALSAAAPLPARESSRLPRVLQEMDQKPPVTVEEAILLFLRADWSVWQRRCGSDVDIPAVQAHLFSYLLLQTEIQHQRRIVAKLQQYAASGDSDHLHIVREMIASERAYPIDINSRVELVHEFRSDMRLRAKQQELLNLLEQDPTDPKVVGRIVQLLMGEGKTNVLAPILVMKAALQGRVALFCVPNAQFGTALMDLERMLWDRFEGYIDLLTFERETCTAEVLKRLIERLRRAETECVVLVTRPKDLHALQLMLKERHEILRQQRNTLKERIQMWAQTQAQVENTKAEAAVVVARARHLAAAIWNTYDRSEVYDGNTQVRGTIECFQSEMQSLMTRMQNWAGQQSPNDEINKKHLIQAVWDKFGFNPLAAPKSDATTGIEQWKDSVQKLLKLQTELREEANLLQAILNLLGVNGVARFDEIANVGDPRNHLSFPIGTQIPANQAAIDAAVRLYFEWLPNVEGLLHLTNNKQTLCQDESLVAVLNHVVSQAWKFYRDDLESCCSATTFSDYLHGGNDSPEAAELEALFEKWNVGAVPSRKRIVQEVAFLKYAVSFGLSGVFGSKAHVHYGRSREHPELKLVVPFECNETPKENTLLRKAWETILKTCQYYRESWEDPEMTADLIRCGLLSDQQGARTSYGKALHAILGEVVSLKSIQSAEAVKRYTKKMHAALRAQAPEALALAAYYLGTQLLPEQAKIDPLQLASTPPDLFGVCGRSDAFGGTWSYNLTWPLNMTQHPKEDTERVRQALLEPRNSKIHKIDTTSAETIARSIRAQATDEMCAVHDPGALLSGVSNKKMAKALLALFPERGGILFYRQVDKSTTKLALMTHKGIETLPGTSEEIIRRTLKEHGISNPITYYDQDHCIAANIVQQPGKYGLILVANQVTLDYIYQAAMRLRGLLLGLQSVQWGVADFLHDDKEWSAARILEETERYQLQRTAPANFHGICELLRAHFRAYIDTRMRREADAEKRQTLYDKGAAYLLEVQANDLFEEFGRIQRREKPYDLFARLIEKMPLKDLAEDEATATRLKTELEAMVSWHKQNNTPLPEWIYMGEELIGATQEVNLARDKQNMQEEENQRMLAGKIPETEVAWTKLDFSQIRSVSVGQSGFEGMPALHKLNDAIPGELFDDALLISENLLRTYKCQSNVMITEDQKPLHRLLVVHHRERYVAVLISEDDAKSLKQMLIENPQANCWIVEPCGVVNQRGSLKDCDLAPFRNAIRPVTRLLVQAALVQGDVKHLADERFGMLPVLNEWLSREPEKLKPRRELFEQVLLWREDDRDDYRSQLRLQNILAGKR